MGQLVCEQPRVVEKYNKLLNQLLENQGIFQQYEKALQLFQSWTINESEMMQLQYTVYDPAKLVHILMWLSN